MILVFAPRQSGVYSWVLLSIVLVGALALAVGPQTPGQTVEQFVDLCINDLTDHTHIKAVIDPDAQIAAGAGAQLAIREATDNLLEPLLSARGANNGGFLSTYNQVLLQKLPPLLDNHL